MKININEYKGSDSSSLKQIVEEFSAYYIPINPWGRNPIDPSTASHFLNKLLENVADKNGIIFLAKDGEELIGFIGIYIREQNQEELLEFKKAKTGYISELFVTEEYRKRGIGKMLLEKAETHLKKMACSYVELEVFGPNTIAQEFYRKNGFENKNIEMIKTL